MRLSDLMSGANLSIYPQIAMILFLFAFVAVTARLFVRPRKSGEVTPGVHDLDAAALLPLADDSAPMTDAAHNSRKEGDHHEHF